MPPHAVTDDNRMLFATRSTTECEAGTRSRDMNRSSFTHAFAFLLALGCGDVENPFADPPRDLVVEAPAAPRDLDVLVVIDDSGSMTDKQQTLATSLPGFLAGLESLPGGLPNLHLGVVTTDMGTSTSTSAPAPAIGSLGQGGCANTGKGGNLTTGMAGASIAGTFLADVTSPDGTRERNYTGSLGDVFGQMTRAGSFGCGFEQPLAAMKAALDDNPANVGFVRPSALLAVIFLTDEDDCSVKDPALFALDSADNPLQSFRCTRFGVTCDVNGATPDDMNVPNVKSGCRPRTDATALLDDVTPFHDFLVGLKGNADHVIVGGIIGTPDPVEVELRSLNGVSQPALKHSCSLAVDNIEQSADPGVRLRAFFDSFGDHSTSSTICQSDYSQPLAKFGDIVARSVGTLCVGAPLADASTEPGFQVDCVVEDVVGDDIARSYEPCDVATGTEDCWLMVADSQSCPDFDHLRLAVVRSETPAPDTVTRALCVTAH